jgi:hypothetical protein
LVLLVAIVLGASGGVVYARGAQVSGGVLLRAGLILGAVWLAWPALARVNRQWLVVVVPAVGLAAVRPALLMWVVPALIVFAVLRGRSV